MRANQQTNRSVQFRLLSEDQLEELYWAALQILEGIGVEVHNEQARAALAEAGAWVEGERVRVRSSVVRAALGAAPRSFAVFSREGDARKDLHLGPGRIAYGPGPTCPGFLDPATGERRSYTRADARAVATVCDALPHVDFVEGLGTVSDTPYAVGDVYEFAEMMACTGKPIVAWSYTAEGCRDIHRMAAAVAGSEAALVARPNYIFYCEPLSPLVSNQEAMDKVLYCARHRVPLIFTPCVIGGGTGPATMAGIVAQAAAESWLGAVIVQHLSPGTPYCMGGVVSCMDMRAMVLAYGAPELSLLQAALTELSHYAGLPTWTTGGCTDAKAVDEQAALEGALSVLFSALSGGDLCHDVGYIESAMTGSLEQLVLMDEAIAYVKRIVRGVEVTPETLAVEAIARVGPGGNFLTDEHTLQHFRREFWLPRLMDRNRRETWEGRGGQHLGERVRARVVEILTTHQPAPLPAPAQRAIAEILEGADARAAG